MAISLTELDRLCRFCASKINVHCMGLSIFEQEENKQCNNVSKKILVCLPEFQITLEDQLPKMMCGDCALKIDEIFDFREKVLQTEDLFLQMLKQQTVKLESVNNKINLQQTNDEMIIQTKKYLRSKQINNLEEETVDSPVTINNNNDDDGISIELGNDQQVIGNNNENVEVDVFSLDKETARIFDEQIREVKIYIYLVVF